MIDDVLDSTPEREEPAAGSPAAAIGRATLGSRLSATLPAGLVGRLVRAVYPRLEPELGRLPEYVPAGGTAVDVGGWFGPWTRRLAGRADRVVTIEADPHLAALLRRTFPRVEVVQAAASDECGEIDLWIPDGGALAGVSSVSGRTGRPVSVARVTVDSLGLTDVRFMKLDVEGHELNALLGAGETIARDRPTLLVEVEERHGQMPDVIALMRSWSYTGHVLLDSGWTPLADFDLTAHQRDTVHELNRGFVSRMLRPGRRYINSVLFTSGPRPPSPTTHG
ncbi:FkbM family methyltransferase [Spirillospora sp. NPDC048819]|uniref:FkbM family methyltransferase n=1 Tax=Spirillospora sp. NPDC048819 TaxID=3155268 RepID=UPI0033C916DF